MLKRLLIQNYALIQQLEINLESGFTAITGETGSGKSILMGALGLGLGERADTHVLFDKTLKCIVEADFETESLGLDDFFESQDLDRYPMTTVRREISPSGRSRAFINDSPVQLTVIKTLARQLVDIHSQHQTMLLQNEEFQLSLLDIFAKHGKALKQYQAAYGHYKQAQDAVAKCQAYIKDNKIDKDYLQFQLDELSQVPLIAGEDGRVAEELGLLEHAEEIKAVLHQVMSGLGGDEAVLDALNSLSHKLEGIASHTKSLEKLSERMDSLRIELEDIQSEVEEVESKVEFDEERQQILQDQMDAYQRLFSKHRLSNVDELIALREEIDEKLLSADSSSQRLEQLMVEMQEAHVLMETRAKVLTKNRIKAADIFEQSVSKQFASVSLKNARIKAEIAPSADFHVLGKDEVRIMFNANKGGSLELLRKVASGGELSRLMLILKSELAQATQLPTLIFDEIDTGVSGEIASQMAEVLRAMSVGRQVIAITHLPQVAARAHQHIRISKSDQGERSITDLEILDSNGRIMELAKMLSGTHVSDASMENAKALLRN